jgi:hypothetical protein
MYQQKELPPARAGCVFRRFCAYISDAGFLFEQHQPLNLIQSKKGNLRCGMFSPQTDCLEYFCHFLTILLLPQNGLYRARGVQVAALRFTFHFGRPNFPCSLQKNSCSNSKAFSYRRQCGPMSFLLYRLLVRLSALSSSPAEEYFSAAMLLGTRTASIALDCSPAISICKPYSKILPTWVKALHGIACDASTPTPPWRF